MVYKNGIYKETSHAFVPFVQKPAEFLYKATIFLYKVVDKWKKVE